MTTCNRALLLVVLLASTPAMAGPPDTSGIGYTQALGSQLPLDASLVATDGRTRTLGAVLDGKPALLVLGYFACPSLCGLIRDDIFSALANTTLRPAQDYNLVFLSIDSTETPGDAAAARIRDLARYQVPGSAEGWHFMTADAATIGRIAGAVGYQSRFDTSLKQFLHPAGVVVVTPAGRVGSYVLGVSFQPGAVQASVGQARQETIGQQALPILLLCFHYDPTTGRYTLAIMKVLRLMGVLAVLTVLGMILLLRRQGSRA